jgi:DNA-binding transcriptional MocR family regulator
MPNLSIIPAAAVMDPELTPTQLRVLCAVGIHTNKLGGGVWASVRTLAREANVSERTFQAACVVLVTKGYLVIKARPGQTNLYDVVLQDTPAAATAPHPRNSSDTPTPAIATAPKRPKGTIPHNELVELVDALKVAYPKRPEEPPYPALLKAAGAALASGAAPDQLYRAARRYAAHCQLNATEPKYVRSLVRFLTDDAWRAYDVATVHGRTREEWARSGQDVLEFDRLLEEAAA